MRIFWSLLVVFCFFSTINVYAQPTVINRGDLVIVAVNANLPAPNSSKDEISFVCFKPITNGTELQLLDDGYSNCQAGLWSGGEGGAKLTRTGGTIPAGTVITFRTTTPYVFVSPDNGWSVTDLFVHPTNPTYSLLAANLNMNSGGDQIYMAQGGTWTETASLCTINGPRTSPNSNYPGNTGRILFGFSTSGSWLGGQASSGESALYPGMECFSMAPTSGTAYNKYTGPLTPATQTTWITRISDVNNWTSYGSSNTYSSSGTNYAGGFTMAILPGGDIPTANWNIPSPLCSTASSIDLSTYITGTTGGIFTGTGVSGNMFNPTGLNGNYDITYTIIYKTCPIAQTNTIRVNGTPAQPTLNITPPSCTVATGTVSVSSSITGLTFSNDGTTYTNTTGVFAGITAGASYSITAKSTAGCISTAATGTMPIQPTPPTQPTVTITPPTCTISTGTVSVSSSTTGLTFSIDGTTYTNTTGVFAGIAAGASYSITAKNASGCISTAATGTMSAAPSTPAQPTLSITPPNCTVITGTVSVSSSTTGLTFSNDGTTYTNTTGVFAGIAAGASYSITAKNASGCISTAATGTMAAAPGAPAQPTLNVTPPTCTVTTGIVSVSSSTSGLTFSSDGTTYTNTTGIFSGIAAGATYSITAKNASGCVSTAATGTMPAAPGAPAQPTLNVTPPTCTVVTGTVSVSSSIAGLTFSSDGTTYTNTTGIFSGIAAGTAYSITAKNAAGCVSTAATGTMPTAPATPTQPTLSITPPTCTVATGTITISSSTTGLTFSSDGTTYTNTTGIFSGIAAGTAYSITAKNASGCISTAVTGTMPTQPITPAQATLSVTPPTCTVATGTVSVSSSTTGLTFSNDGTTYTNTTGIFSGITAGSTYSITAKNVSGCVSTTATGTMPAAPAAPAQPTLIVTPPTCTVATGTITVSSSTTGLTFSSDGTTYTNTTGIFAGIAAGTAYSITAKNASGCISTAATGTMAIQPTTPTQPTLTVTPPTCTVATGTVSVSSSITGLTFSSDGITYTNTTGIFAGIAASASYSITAKSSAGCVSTAATGTMPAQPTTPAQPTVNITDPICSTPTATITVTSTLTGLTFSKDGVTYTNTNGIFSGITGGTTYSITAKNAAGCISLAATGTIPAAPSIPAQPTLSVTPPTCTVATGTVAVTSSTTGLTFSNDGTTYTNTTGVFAGITGGAAYSITAKNTVGCVSTAATGTMPVQPTTPTQPTLSVTPPTCTVATGTVAVTSSTTGLTFSNDGITYTNTTGVFSGIVAGAAYSITAKNTAGCISTAATGVMPTAPAIPTQPTLGITPPTCTVSTGTITVTNTLTGLTFSKDGVTYTNTTGVFAGITGGAAYSVTAKNAAGCISTAATGTMPATPATPTQPTLNVTPPTCTVATGTISVSSSTSGLTFSSNGTTYTNTTGVFTVIAAGATYSITAKNAAGCISTATTGTMPVQPTTPVQPILSITPPTCTVSTGTITVTSTLTGLTFSKDGVTYTNTTGVFAGITGGAAYSITAKNAVGCISMAATGTMPATPATPTQPTLNVTPPTCTVATGTVSVSSSTTGLTFSNNGTTYTNTTGVFTGITAGASYSITSKNTSGCISTAATGLMPLQPTTPTQPTLNITAPTCTTPTGTITVTNTISGLTFSKDGITYTNTTGIFTGIAAGAAYSITAKNAAGCISTAATGIMAAAPTTPSVPTVNITSPTCATSTATITVTSTLSGLTFSKDGVTYTNTTGIFTGITGGTAYSITARNSAGCVSAAATGTIPAAPATPTQPIVNITAPTCTTPTGTITVTNTLTGVTFSKDGVTYSNTTGVFTGIAGGSAYSITAKNAAGCVSTAATGTMPATPVIPITPVLTAVNSCGSSTITASGFTGSLTWSDGGSGNPRIFSTAAGPITVTQTVGTCTSIASNAVSVLPGSPLTPNLGKDIFLCPGQKVTLDPGKFDNYVWQDNSTSPKLTVSSPGTYTVTVRNNVTGSCSGTDEVKINYFVTCNEIYFPTAFSPNGDGLNDNFGPIGNLNVVTNYLLTIYNRYGELVFKSTNPFEKWNGNHLGVLSAPANYVWHADFLFRGVARIQKGNVTIVR